MDQKSMSNAMDHAAGLCCSTITVKTADCAAPMKFIHVVSDSCAGYFFNVIPYMIYIYTHHHLSCHIPEKDVLN